MLSAIRSIVLGRAETETVASISVHEFQTFCANSLERWQVVTDHLDTSSPERFPNGYYEISLHPVDVTPANSLSVLQARLSNARRIRLTGWTPFLDMNREEWRPYPINDHVEAWIGRKANEDTPREPQFSDYWRASRRGQLYTIRGYTEDSLEERKGVKPRQCIDVTLPIWRLGEVLYFAGRFVNGGPIMLHARRPGGPVAAAQKCATYGPLSVVSRGGGCTAWSSMQRFDWRLSMRG